jgi:hypothetical protein
VVAAAAGRSVASAREALGYLDRVAVIVAARRAGARDLCGGTRPAPVRRTDHSWPRSAETDPGLGPGPWDVRERRADRGLASAL